MAHVVDDELPERIAERHQDVAKDTLRDLIAGMPAAHGRKVDVEVGFGRSFGELAKKHQQKFDQMFREQLAEFVARISKPARSYSTIVRDGRPEEVILSTITETRPQLVVVGTHGRSGIGRALLGSVAERVIARSPADVLAVRGW